MSFKRILPASSGKIQPLLMAPAPLLRFHVLEHAFVRGEQRGGKRMEHRVLGFSENGTAKTGILEIDGLQNASRNHLRPEFVEIRLQLLLLGLVFFCQLPIEGRQVDPDAAQETAASLIPARFGLLGPVEQRLLAHHLRFEFLEAPIVNLT